MGLPGRLGFINTGISSGGGLTPYSLTFRIGDGGVNTPAAGQPIFNPASNPLAGKTVLNMFGGGLYISPTANAAAGDLSWAFDSGTGQVTLSNGNFDNNTVYSFEYR